MNITLFGHLKGKLRRNPGEILTVVGIMAVSLGWIAVVLGAFYTTFLKPLSVEEPERLISVFSTVSGKRLSYENLRDYNESTDTLESISAMISDRNMVWKTQDPFQTLNGRFVDGNFFEIVKPDFILGRGFKHSDTGFTQDINSAVLSNGLWQRAFNGDPKILGKEMVLNETSITIIGVLDQGFKGT